MPDTFSAENAVAGYICTEEKPSSRKTTISNVVDFKGDNRLHCTLYPGKCA